MITINGRAIADEIEGRVRETIKQPGLKLSLASLFIGEATDSALYTKRKVEAAERLGVAFAVERLSADVSTKAVEEKIKELNERAGLDGYLIQLPLPGTLRSETDRLLNLMNPNRDVDGLMGANRDRLLKNGPGPFLPTPVAAVMIMLASCFKEVAWQEQLPFLTSKLPRLVPTKLRGEQATIISDGDVFGPTLKFVLERGGMRATVERSDSPTLRTALAQSGLVVSAVGKPRFLTGDMIAGGSIVIDVGTTLVDGKTVGDADWESVAAKASAATPVPGGVGPVTVAMIFANALFLKLQRNTN